MISNRIKELTPFIVMDVLERADEMAHEGIDIIHLEVGEPDFDIPACVKDAICKAIQDGQTFYTHSLGMIELREAICQHYLEIYGVTVHPDQVLVTSGTSPAMLIVFAALLENDDQVILSDPHYACYPNFIKFVGGKPLTVPVYESEKYEFQIERVQAAITEKTKAIFINSPSNPTGTLLSESCLREIASLPIHIISDEIYHGLVYEGKEHSILEYRDDVFVLNGFSKLHAMTGLRLGYLIAPKKFIRPMQILQQNFLISANSVAQIGGLAALKDAHDDITNMKAIYNKRRKYMIQRLRQMGFEISVEPTGAFYVFVNARHLSNDSYQLAFNILEKAHVGVTPGIDFGNNAEGYLRFSYANSIENIAEGMDRLENYIRVKTSPATSSI
ncbi:MAG: Aspartate aminotransferase [Candidatus Magnetoglobus multicellularis str. Araruama]|uniref:Aminotransferase n=1 Tax=Candidatus Magnetoglobus multicellularis str. Araruama TaxID=890399 RepID=A0A1V1PCM2_9BACT|nr:MAG: Aspartate aminotransferase [Candidatus Magnetoglobus multicellularis str. Araruama]